LVRELRGEKQFTAQYLADNYNVRVFFLGGGSCFVLCIPDLTLVFHHVQISSDLIEKLFAYAKFQFECGNYNDATVYLFHYRLLSQQPDRLLSALWGKFACDILVQAC
jgi:hypothetical protein